MIVETCSTIRKCALIPNCCPSEQLGWLLAYYKVVFDFLESVVIKLQDNVAKTYIFLSVNSDTEHHDAMGEFTADGDNSSVQFIRYVV